MATVSCAHCQGTGSCKCFTCVKEARGEEYAKELETNKVWLDSYNQTSQSGNPLTLLLVPRAAWAAQRLNETYKCSTCGGKGVNYVGPTF